MFGIGIRRWHSVAYEQAVYGSFRFWDRGYAVLARSGGCRPEWIQWLKGACQRIGERPPGFGELESLWALRMPGGAWMVVGMFPQGVDDRGRPGAQAFHALFVSRWAYWRAGANPFVFAPALRGDWEGADRDRLLPTDRLVLAGGDQPAEREPDDPRVDEIVGELTRGRKVVVEAAEPITWLARAVWRRLPGRVRRQASVATWTFRTDNGFDLAGLPRLVGSRVGSGEARSHKPTPLASAEGVFSGNQPDHNDGPRSSSS